MVIRNVYKDWRATGKRFGGGTIFHFEIAIVTIFFGQFLRLRVGAIDAGKLWWSSEGIGA